MGDWLPWQRKCPVSDDLLVFFVLEGKHFHGLIERERERERARERGRGWVTCER